MDNNDVLDHSPIKSGHHEMPTTPSKPLSSHLTTKSKKTFPNPNPTKRTT